MNIEINGGKIKILAPASAASIRRIGNRNYIELELELEELLEKLSTAHTINQVLKQVARQEREISRLREKLDKEIASIIKKIGELERFIDSSRS